LHNWSSGASGETALGDEPPAECEFTFKAERAPGVVSLYRYGVRDRFSRPLLVRTKNASGRYSLGEIQKWASNGDGIQISDSPVEEAARTAIRSAQPYHFLFDSDPIWSRMVEAAARRAGDQEVGDAHADDESPRQANSIEVSSFVAKYSAVVDFAENHVTAFLRDVLYLGPLRDEPKRLYEISGDSPLDVGVRGQLSPEILLRSSKQVLYKRVNRWLREFDLPGDLASDQFTDTAFRLVLQGLPDSRPTNFADVGFGYSQVLPLLVQGLTAEKESLIIAEQPEIHLNPRLQSRLADFFGQVTKRDVSILVETHSEHLVLGLRRLVAQGTLQADDVAIYFVERTNGTSTARRVPIQENGHVESSDWPSGFFEDSLRESFELASAQVRRKRAR